MRGTATMLAEGLARDLVLAHRILYRHQVLDAWGHVSVRDPDEPSAFWMMRARPPALVTSADLVRLDLDGNAVAGDDHDLYLERFIHAASYRARGDVTSVLHSHSSNMIPFGVTGTALRPLTQVAGFLGAGSPIFDIREVDDGPDFLIANLELGAAMAARLGDASVVLLRGHGAVSVATSVRQVVWRGIYGEINARQQREALQLGTPQYLSSEEAGHGGARTPPDRNRAWDLWVHEVSSCACGTDLDVPVESEESKP